MDSYSYYNTFLSNKLASRATSEGLKSKIFLGGMPKDPPTLCLTMSTYYHQPDHFTFDGYGPVYMVVS